MVNAAGIGITLAYVVGILFVIGAIVALAVDLASAEHLISYATAAVAVTLVAIGIAIIIIMAYLQKKGEI